MIRLQLLLQSVNCLSLLHLLQAFLHTCEAASLGMYRVRLELARGQDLGQQVNVPLSIRLLESQPINKTRIDKYTKERAYVFE